MNKKFLSFVTTAAVFASLVPAVTVSAADNKSVTVTFRPQVTEAEAGDTVDFDIVFVNNNAIVNKEIRALIFSLQFPEGGTLVTPDGFVDEDDPSEIYDVSIDWSSDIIPFESDDNYLGDLGYNTVDFTVNPEFVNRYKDSYPNATAIPKHSDHTALTDAEMEAALKDDPYRVWLSMESGKKANSHVGEEYVIGTFSVKLDDDFSGDYAIGLKDLGGSSQTSSGKEVVEVKLGDTQAVTVKASSTVSYTLVPAKAATHFAEGNTAYYKGSDGKYYADAQGKTEITLASTVTPKLPHDYGTEWKSDAAYHWKECTIVGCGVEIDGFIKDKAEHSLELENDKEPTQTEKGYTGDWVCSVCGYTVKGKDIDMLPADSSSAASTDTSSAASTDTSSAASADTSSAASTETSSAASTETSSAASTETSSAASTETSSAASTETSSAAATETSSAASTETSSAASTETSSAAATESSEAAKELEHVAAKAATATEDGNVEYYYDKETGKYYKDADGTEEIAAADVVIPATGTTDDSTESKADDSVESKADDSTESKADSKADESKTDSKADESKTDSKADSKNDSKAADSKATSSAAANNGSTSNPNTGVAPAVMSMGVLALGAVIASKKRK